MQNRIEWIDSYKGLLILMVFMYHVIDDGYIQSEILRNIMCDPYKSLRMPAFFFISGFLLSKKYQDFPFFFRHRFRQIVVPYFVFFLINYLFWIVFGRANTPDLNLLDPFYGLFKGTTERSEGGSIYLLTAAPLWFVTTLFIAQMYFFAIKKYFKSNIKILIVLGVLALLGFFSNYLFHRTLHIRPWWNMDVALTATVFYGLGYLVKVNNLIHKIDIAHTQIRFIAMALLLAISMGISLINPVSMSTNGFGNPILFYIAAYSGIVGMIFFVKMKFIQNNTFLEYFGQNTYLVLAFHVIALEITNFFLENIGLSKNSIEWIISFMILSVVVMIVIVEFFNRYFDILSVNKCQSQPLFNWKIFSKS